MLLSPRKKRLTSFFKEVRVFKGVSKVQGLHSSKLNGTTTMLHEHFPNVCVRGLTRSMQDQIRACRDHGNNGEASASRAKSSDSITFFFENHAVLRVTPLTLMVLRHKGQICIRIATCTCFAPCKPLKTENMIFLQDDEA